MKGSTGLKSPPSSLGREGKRGRWEVIISRNGFWSFFPQRIKGHGKRLRKPRKTQRGHLRRGENQCKYQYKNRKQNTHTHSNKRATEIFVSFS